MDARGFYAMLDRSRFIQRWSLMRNTQQENIAEHSFMTAVIAHALAIIRLERFPESFALVPEMVLSYALYHDVTEVITGDLPTPVKYHDQEIQSAYKRIEALAAEDLLQGLPEDMRKYYSQYLDEEAKTEEEKEIRVLVKAADKIAAYIKCVSELAQGNNEFKEAEKSTLEKIRGLELAEAEIFISEFIGAFKLSLDQLRNGK